MKSYTEKEINNALDELQKRTAGLEGHELRAALTQFINEQPVYSEGKITVLWSGVRNEAEYIAKHASEFKDIRMLNKTLANDILDSDAFNALVAKSFGVSPDEFKIADRNSPLGKLKTDYLFDGKKGLWAQISRRFALETTGEVRIMAKNPRVDSVLVATEIETLLEERKVTKIDGSSLDEIIASQNPKEYIVSSAAYRTALADTENSKFIQRWMDIGDDSGLKRLLNNSSQLDLERANEAIEGISKTFGIPVSSSVWGKLSNLGNKAKKTLPVIGWGFTLLAVMSVSQEAKAAEARGDTKRAKELWVEFVAGELGSEIASTAAGVATGVLGVFLLGLSAPVAAVAGIAVGIVSGIYGEDLGKEFAKLTKDMDNNQRMDLLDRMSTLAFGQDFNVADLPAALEKHAVKLNIGDISLENLIAKAQTDIAYRYALRELTPFVAEGADYSAYNTDGSLDLLGKGNPNGMSAEYIKSRAEMLLLQMRYLKNGLKLGRDLTDDITQGDWDYLDYGKHPFAGNPDRPLEFSIDGDGISTDDHRIAFGSSNDDIIEGSGKSDRLFGAEGNDTLKGGKGSDYMEGGQGYDTYHIQDNDTISDSDMRGEILFPNKVPATETSEETILGYDTVPSFFTKSKNDANKWEAPNPKGEYYPFSAERKGNDLVVSHASDSVTIKDFFTRAAHTEDSSGTLWSGLGIQLLDKPAGAAQVYRSVEKFDSKPVKLNDFQIRANPAENVMIQGNDGTDIVMSHTAKSLTVDATGGDDVVYGLKSGGNVLLGGDGRDMLLGANYSVRNADAGIDMLVAMRIPI